MPFVVVESVARSSETETRKHWPNEDLISVETYPNANYNESKSEDRFVEFTNKECSTDDLCCLKSGVREATMTTTQFNLESKPLI